MSEMLPVMKSNGALKALNLTNVIFFGSIQVMLYTKSPWPRLHTDSHTKIMSLLMYQLLLTSASKLVKVL